MKRFSRRRFLQISAGSMGAAAMAGALPDALATVRGGTGEIRKIPTYCDVCFWKCGAVAYVRDGALWKIEGHPEDPLSRGRLCPRGTGGIGAYSDPDRLTSPLLRTKSSKRGGEQWTAVTWHSGHFTRGC